MSSIALFLRKQLAEDIERIGGIKVVFSQDKKDQTLSKLLDEKVNVYGKRGSDIRKQIRNLAKRWHDYSAHDYKRRVLERLDVAPYSERVREPPSSRSRSSSSSSSSSSRSPSPPPKKSTPKLSSPKRQTKVRFELYYRLIIRSYLTHAFFYEGFCIISISDKNHAIHPCWDHQT